jgi:hypothetical protein
LYLSHSQDYFLENFNMATFDPAPSSTSVKIQSKPARSPLMTPEMLISLATPGVLLALLGGKIVGQSVQALGILSEDLLRGDRLPMIPTTQAQQP